jgi:hypothetical protein
MMLSAGLFVTYYPSWNNSEGDDAAFFLIVSTSRQNSLEILIFADKFHAGTTDVALRDCSSRQSRVNRQISASTSRRGSY